jgi:hypothetical protein
MIVFLVEPFCDPDKQKVDDARRDGDQTTLPERVFYCLLDQDVDIDCESNDAS